MGEVYKARDTRLDRTVAVKVLPSHLADNVDLKKRFELEARAISSLNHPNICTLYDIGCEDGIDFIVMELLEGETLANRLKKGPLPRDEALRIGAQMAEAYPRSRQKSRGARQSAFVPHGAEQRLQPRPGTPGGPSRDALRLRSGLRYFSKGPRLWERFGARYGDGSSIHNFFLGSHPRWSDRAEDLRQQLEWNYQ